MPCLTPDTILTWRSSQTCGHIRLTLRFARAIKAGVELRDVKKYSGVLHLHNWIKMFCQGHLYLIFQTTNVCLCVG